MVGSLQGCRSELLLIFVFVSGAAAVTIDAVHTHANASTDGDSTKRPSGALLPRHDSSHLNLYGRLTAVQQLGSPDA